MQHACPRVLHLTIYAVKPYLGLLRSWTRSNPCGIEVSETKTLPPRRLLPLDCTLNVFSVSFPSRFSRRIPHPRSRLSGMTSHIYTFPCLSPLRSYALIDASQTSLRTDSLSSPAHGRFGIVFLLLEYNMPNFFKKVIFFEEKKADTGNPVSALSFSFRLFSSSLRSGLLFRNYHIIHRYHHHFHP